MKSLSEATSCTSCVSVVRTARPITPSSSGRPSGIIAYPQTPTDHSRPCSSMKAETPAPRSPSCKAPRAASIASVGSWASPAAATAASNAAVIRSRPISSGTPEGEAKGSIDRGIGTSRPLLDPFQPPLRALNGRCTRITRRPRAARGRYVISAPIRSLVRGTSRRRRPATRATSPGSRLLRRARRTPPAAREGAKGMPILRAALPCRARITSAGTSAKSEPAKSATITGAPSQAPRKAAILTSPIPSPAG